MIYSVTEPAMNDMLGENKAGIGTVPSAVPKVLPRATDSFAAIMPRTKVGSPRDPERVAPGKGCLALLRHLPFSPHLCRSQC